MFLKSVLQHGIGTRKMVKDKISVLGLGVLLSETLMFRKQKKTDQVFKITIS